MEGQLQLVVLLLLLLHFKRLASYRVGFPCQIIISTCSKYYITLLALPLLLFVVACFALNDASRC